MDIGQGVIGRDCLAVTPDIVDVVFCCAVMVSCVRTDRMDGQVMRKLMMINSVGRIIYTVGLTVAVGVAEEELLLAEDVEGVDVASACDKEAALAEAASVEFVRLNPSG